ncbi:MAG: triose-phosphate isomerase [Rhodoglobus sp.]|nr:triose-phosphate isomerase [Rhodoglobus sp.]
MTKKKLIAGNWKMNGSLAANDALVRALVAGMKDAACTVAVCVPAPYLAQVQALCAGSALELGAQDVSPHEQGAYTGEVSAAMLKEFGVRYAIVGHSERRQYHGETDEQLGRKVAAAIKHGLVPILCVGETADDLEKHGPSAVPVAQLRAALAGAGLVDKKGTPDIVVAYEPVWAIGSGQAATAEQAEQVAAKLRETLAELLGADVADATRILYGGSVKSGNIASFMREPNVDGALVGGASLDVTEFASIARFQKHVGT